MADMREQLNTYLETLDGANAELRAQLEQATIEVSKAEVRAAAAEGLAEVANTKATAAEARAKEAEAKTTEAQTRAKECEAKEETAETQAEAARLEAATQKARADALDGSMASERLARIEADKRCTAMMADMKKQPPPPVQLPVVKTAKNAGYEVTITRDAADNMRHLSIVPRTVQ